MFDDEQRGWSAGLDYEMAAEAAGLVALPEPGETDGDGNDTDETDQIDETDETDEAER